MKCYHFTNIKNIESIKKYGLIPKNGDNSKMIDDNKTKVFFSEGYTGCIALYVDFNIVYNDIINGEGNPTDEVKKKVLDSNSFEEYIGNCVYLAFEKNDLYNERNFENGCTEKSISPDELYICILKNENEYTTSFHEIVKYMMFNTKVEDIIYYGEKYDNSPSVESATNRIQAKVKKYYEDNEKEINKFKNKDYKIEYIKLDEYYK